MNKPVLLEKYRVNARQIAEQLWGRGGTSTYKTTRRGVTWFSCSGHGGIVIDSADMTIDERAKLVPYIQPEKMHVLTGIKDGKKYVLASVSPFNCTGRRVSYPANFTNVKWEERDFYTFEEDCAWCLAYLFLGISTLNTGTQLTPEQVNDIAKRTFQNYFAN